MLQRRCLAFFLNCSSNRRIRNPGLYLAILHHEPDTALSDGPQSIFPEAFAALVGELRQIAPVLGRTL